jgi:hypothetical protein
MRPNVTPRYLFVISSDSTYDQEPVDNVYSKYVRFYIKKSQRDILISASNIFHKIYDTSGTRIFPDTNQTNMDKVAGRLNLDSLISGLRRIGFEQAKQGLNEDPEFDFDIIDRSV